MKRLTLLFALLPLSACTSSTVTYEPDLDSLLSNPLYAERYAENIVDTMVNFEIYQDPILEDDAKAKIIDQTKEKWLKVAKKARKAQRSGAKGGFVPLKKHAEGEVMYADNKLHIAPEFFAVPGPSIHVYITTAVDPRDVDFPDESGFDLGELKTMYGAQTYSVPEVENPRLYRTAVLYDTELEVLWGFAQMTPIFDE